ncbi:filamin-A isoform X2 [Trichogramma pretiosum]|uniref:filamin-A isoform X2 n=1 Tax=Trichogramma pretiosum TaxID=7493 RepID=UPI000C71921F|nr:filamin-A isoform X2 [Trichogramma pretiosum]
MHRRRETGAAAAEQLDSSELVGLVARSVEGTAAKGMPIKGHEDLWVDIQANTFRNWVNEHLRQSELGRRLGPVVDLESDFGDGTRLCALVEQLTGNKHFKWHRDPVNQHQHLENVSAALKAVEADGVKLVNIGNVDIVNGNHKLILGLIWSLIVRYQIGKSKFPPRKLMLSWLKAVLPECRVNNFTTDWNSGIYLSALLDYCRPGLFPHWRHLDPHDKVYNCEKAMEMAKREFDIPIVLQPEYLASPYLDELSGMTYLSYFMKDGSPGFHSTLRWVNSQVPHCPVKNFTSDWNDGRVLCSLVRKLGGPAPAYDRIDSRPSAWEHNLQLGIDAGKKLGVEPLLKAKDMADQNVEHLGVMAYAAFFQWVKPRPQINEQVLIHIDSTSARIHQPAHFKLELLSKEVNTKEVRGEVIGPSDRVECRLSWSGLFGKGTFVPSEIGMHKLMVYNDGELLDGCPYYFRVHPPLTKIKAAGMDPCAIGSIVEVLVNSFGTSHEGIKVTALSPSGRSLACPVRANDGVHVASFQPDETGEWSIAITHKGAYIQGGPFTCFVFDPHGIRLLDTEAAVPGQMFTFTIDASGTGGLGDIAIDIVHDKRSISHYTKELSDMKYRVSFLPKEPGKYRVYVYFNGSDVRGSPFPLKIGNTRGSRRASKDSILNESLDRSSSTSSLERKMNGLNMSKLSNSPLSSAYPNSFKVRDNASNSSSKDSTPQRLYKSTYDHGIVTPPRNVLNKNSNHWRQSSFNEESKDEYQTESSYESGVPYENKSSLKNYYNKATNSKVTEAKSYGTTSKRNVSENGVVDTSSNVKVSSSSVGEGLLRRDSWDAIAKTKSLLSHGSLESLVNLAKSSVANESKSNKDFDDDFNGLYSEEKQYKNVMNYSSLQRKKVESEYVTTFTRDDESILSSRAMKEIPVKIVETHSSPVAKSYLEDKYSRMQPKANQAMVTGSALENLPLYRPTSFTLDSSLEASKISVIVTGPNGRPVPVQKSNYRNQTYTITADQIGEYTIQVLFNGKHVTGSPFRSQAYNAQAIVVGDIPDGVINEPVEFEIDGSDAGSGNLEILVNGGHVTSFVTTLGNQRFLASFVPHEAVSHLVEMTFNGEAVPGSPWKVNIMPSPKMSVLGDSVRLVPAGSPAVFELSALGFSSNEIQVQIIRPNGQAVPAQVTDNKDTTCTVSFTPRIVGEHRISVSHRNQPVLGSPFSCKVYDVAAIKVKDAKRGVIGLPVTFLVETSQAGPGNLEVKVNGGRVPTSAQAQGPHTYAISFTPREPITHTVDLRFNGEDVPGSPFTCQVNDTAKVLVSEALEKVSVQRVASFVIEADSKPTVDVLAPTRESLPVIIDQTGPTTYNAGFTPKDVGDHSVQVKLKGAHVQGSPFLVKAYNANQVKVTDINSGVVGKPVFFSINASQAGAGNLEIIVAVNGKNVPNFVQSEGNAKFRVNFKPQEAALHSLSVRFNGEPVPGSPFTCQVFGIGQTLISGHNLKMAPVKQPITFVVDPQAASNKCDVIVTPPSNIALPITIEPLDQKYKITFTPIEVGRHNVGILVDGEPINGSPFACNVYDVTKVHISGLTEALLGQATTFTVDAAQAGEGTLELVVSTENNTVKAEVVACARGLYDVTFVPQTTAPHYVNISFNDDNVPGSPFKCLVVGSILDGPTMVRVGNTAYIDLDTGGLVGPINAEVTGPDGIIIPCSLIKLDSHLHRVEVRTRQVGTYNVAFSQDSKVLSTQSIQAFDPNKIVLQEVSDAICHRPASVVVAIPKDAGPGKLSVHVRSGGADVDSLVREKDKGLYEIIFHPTRAAPHRLHVKYNDVHIQGSPLEVAVRGPTGGREVTATGLGLYQSSIGKVTSFSIETLGRPGKEFDVVISSPQGNAVPVRCYQHRDGNLLAEFTTHSVGTYKIDVLHGAKPVLGSPFYCQAFDANKIKIHELGPSVISVHDHFAFKIIKSEAGVAELDVTATSPSGQELPLHITSLNDGAEMVEFSPSTSGSYSINVSYGGCPVPGSPIVCTVESTGQARAKGQGLLQGHVGKPAHFTVTGSRSPPAIQVDGPDSVAKPTIEAGPSPGTWNCSYVPSEPGVFDVRIACAGHQLPGSPWHPKIVDSRNLRVIGGWPALCDEFGRLKLAAGSKISFDTTEAGPGELTGTLADQPLDFEMTSNNRLKLVVPQVNAGEHPMEILFNGVPFPGAPKLAVATESESISTDSRVMLRGRGLTSAKCGEQVSFTIDGSQAGSGTPQVQIFSPTSEIDVVLQHLGNSVYRASYTPFTTDSLLMTVSWNGRQLKGCPLQINVTSAADASRVICSGQGLKYGVVGQEIKSFIDTRRAGPGELTAQCVGPHKVAYCELYDHGDATFTLNIKPQEAGRHALTIKYAGEHVPGSPFTLKVSGAPDASKVRVYGPGVEHGVLATFQSRFICDTRGAGAGQLTVRVRGPKGAFRVEMQRETQKDRIILCRYDPTEPGDYRVEVRWAGVLVPGSPFPVRIVDTQDELLMLTQGNESCNTGHHTIASWRGSQAIL